MLVRSFASLFVVALLLVGASSVHAEEGLPNDSTLSDMGLAGIAVMSDADAMTIRGLGYYPHYNNHYAAKPSATAYGHSYASVNSFHAQAYSEDGFNATGPHHATGNHGSHAGIVIQGYGWGFYSPPKQVTAFSGGYSYSSTD